jgi:hypothetical protein
MRPFALETADDFVFRPVIAVSPSASRAAQRAGFVPRVPFVGRHYRIDQGPPFLTIMLG